MEKITIFSQDGVELIGLYRHAKDAKGCALLLHMMPATKESWDPFAEALIERGCSSLAVDLRGHGESLRQADRILDYHEFTDAEHQAARLDVEASADWLLGKEAAERPHFAVIGASIGANLAIRHAAAHPDTRACIALSPGLDYRGVRTEDAVKAMREDQALLIAVSKEDETSYASVRSLEQLPTRAEEEVVYLEGAGHGTTMFEREPDFMRETLDRVMTKIA